MTQVLPSVLTNKQYYWFSWHPPWSKCMTVIHSSMLIMPLGTCRGRQGLLRGWKLNECHNKQAPKIGETEAGSLDCLTTLVIQIRFSSVKQSWASARSPQWLHDSKASCLKLIPCYKPHNFKNNLLEAILKLAEIHFFPRFGSYFGRWKRKWAVANFLLLTTLLLAQIQIILTAIHTYTHE